MANVPRTLLNGYLPLIALAWCQLETARGYGVLPNYGPCPQTFAIGLFVMRHESVPIDRPCVPLVHPCNSQSKLPQMHTSLCLPQFLPCR
eukprot:scaffold1809_cov386-Prasinococcus_capsulatus_cf.AAC.39